MPLLCITARRLSIDSTMSRHSMPSDPMSMRVQLRMRSRHSIGPARSNASTFRSMRYCLTSSVSTSASITWKGAEPRPPRPSGCRRSPERVSPPQEPFEGTNDDREQSSAKYLDPRLLGFGHHFCSKVYLHRGITVEITKLGNHKRLEFTLRQNSTNRARRLPRHRVVRYARLDPATLIHPCQKSFQRVRRSLRNSISE